MRITEIPMIYIFLIVILLIFVFIIVTTKGNITLDIEKIFGLLGA